jgi:peptidoglycan/LPS O-acetylase OafA/YrhL
MTQVLIIDGQASPPQFVSATRIPAFDFTKGMLVLFMVLFHWLNYFYGPQGDVYKYLRFLTPSFIFITGFLISHVLFAKYGINNQKLPQRLALRGLKILAIFVILNLLITLSSSHHSAAAGFLEHSPYAFLTAIFITGLVYSGPYSKAASFLVLVPIGYLLVSSAILLIVGRTLRFVFQIVFALSLLSAVAVSIKGMQVPNLELLTIGLLGVICGFASEQTIQLFVSHKYALIIAYILYLVAATVWDVPFGLRIVGVILTVALLFILGTGDNENGRLRRHILLLGRYSLFGYISQIALLQALHWTLRHTNLGLKTLAISFVGGFGLTMLSVELADRARKRSATLDHLYKAIFA